MTSIDEFHEHPIQQGKYGGHHICMQESESLILRGITSYIRYHLNHK